VNATPPTRRRVFDWRFLLMLAVLLMVAYLVYVGVAAVRDGRTKDEQVHALIGTIRADNADAARERGISAHNQRLLLDYTKALAERQGELVGYLQRHGVKIPARYLGAVPSPTLRNPATGHPIVHHAATGHHRTPAASIHHTHHVSHHAVHHHQVPTSPPPVHGGTHQHGHQPPPAAHQHAPGHSGSAPGHNKHGGHPAHPTHPRVLAQLLVRLGLS